MIHYTMKKKSLNCLNYATFRKLSDYNLRKKLLNFLNVAQLRQFSDFLYVEADRKKDRQLLLQVVQSSNKCIWYFKLYLNFYTSYSWFSRQIYVINY